MLYYEHSIKTVLSNPQHSLLPRLYGCNSITKVLHLMEHKFVKLPNLTEHGTSNVHRMNVAL